MSRSFTFFACVSWCAFLGPLPGARAQAGSGAGCFGQVAKLTPPDGGSDEYFALSLALAGDTLLVGEFEDGANGASSGAAYVFVRSGSGWMREARLLASDGAAGDDFGQSVSLHGDTALVGAPGDDDNGNLSGAAYVFVRDANGWTQQAKLTPGDGSAGDLFGRGVALDGDTALVGAADDDDNGPSSGSVYVFVRDGASWSQQAKLTASDGLEDDNFGRALSLQADTALVGAPNADPQGSLSGAAYVFVRSGTSWSQQAKLTPADGAATAFFGRATALSGDTAAVGRPSHQDGAVYIFSRSAGAWAQSAKLEYPDGSANERFGNSVALVGNVVVIGDTVDDEAATQAGAAYVFAHDGLGWALHEKLLAADAVNFQNLGASMSMSAEFVVVGASDLGGEGSAYVFSLPPIAGTSVCACPAGVCGNADAEAGCANSTGAGARLCGYGTRFPDEVHLVVHGARPDHFALLLEGDAPDSTPFGDGLRCVGGALVLFPAQPVELERDGSFTYGPCFGDAPISSLTGVVPGSGDHRFYQYWYRDAGGPCGSSFNLSNAYEIEW